jgi:hypothetical protein
LKPENVLIVAFPRVKLGDFGLCGFLTESQLMRTFCGSPGYCAPECISKIKYDGRQSDVWSLGVLLFSIVAGEHPWNVSNSAVMIRQILKAAFTVPSHVSGECKQLIERMIRLVPSERMTMSQILEHPWLKLGEEVAWSEEIPIPVFEEPERRPLTMREISEKAGRAHTQAEGGIASPFGDGRSAVVLKLRARALSFDQGGIAIAEARARPIATLAQTRQRSVSHLRGVAPSRTQALMRRSPVPVLSS